MGRGKDKGTEKAERRRPGKKTSLDLRPFSIGQHLSGTVDPPLPTQGLAEGNDGTETSPGPVVVCGQVVEGLAEETSEEGMSKLPLFAEARRCAAWGEDANLGLAFDKFCDTWSGRWSTLGSADDDKLDKEGFLRKVVNHKGTSTNRIVGNASLLKEMRARRSAMLEQPGRLTKTDVFTADWRWTAGLGRGHPVENGFSWHHTLGVPYLAGASVKGVIRAWARDWLGETGRLVHLLGSDTRNAQDRREATTVGRVIVLDALPVEPVEVLTDVMTPHYGEYYQASEGSTQIPGDWFAPIPIPFLSVAPGQTLSFALRHRLPKEETAADELNLVWTWLEEALTCLGAGAKTATGYGRFSIRQDEPQRPHEAKTTTGCGRFSA